MKYEVVKPGKDKLWINQPFNKKDKEEEDDIEDDEDE